MMKEVMAGVELARKSAGSSGEPLVSAELADALQDAGAEGIQIVLNAAVTRGDYKVVAYCMQLTQALLNETIRELSPHEQPD